MRLEPGHVNGSRIVHLTHTTLCGEALCGDVVVDLAGEPDLAILCDDCDRIGREAGEDSAQWIRLARTLTLVGAPAAIASGRRAA